MTICISHSQTMPILLCRSLTCECIGLQDLIACIHFLILHSSPEKKGECSNYVVE
nr:hypothetical protein Iba_scaffold31049CG0010 [Ipomoea batatas]GMD65000.1 hypothetical protein Iba_chr12cCG1170 [Ipomoea batatas]